MTTVIDVANAVLAETIETKQTMLAGATLFQKLDLLDQGIEELGSVDLLIVEEAIGSERSIPNIIDVCLKAGIPLTIMD